MSTPSGRQAGSGVDVSTPPHSAPRSDAHDTARISQVWLYLGEIALVCVGVTLVLAIGAERIPLGDVFTYLWASDGSQQALIVRTDRFPRALLALALGGSLAAAGALMQGITRNPLASPAIFGINAGAALFVVAGITLWGALSTGSLIWLAFAGGTVAGGVVFLLSSATAGASSPFRLTIAGAAMAALLTSVTQGLLVVNEQTLDAAKRWLVGSLEGRSFTHLFAIAPFVIVALILAVWAARSLTTLSLGEDVSKALGVRTALTKATSSVAVILLAGSAVAVAGPVSFVGLAVPHITRYFVGGDYRRVIPHTILQGGALVLMADALARWVISPQELPVGVVTALIGGPIFVYLARKGMKQV